MTGHEQASKEVEPNQWVISRPDIADMTGHFDPGGPDIPDTTL